MVTMWGALSHARTWWTVTLVCAVPGIAWLAWLAAGYPPAALSTAAVMGVGVGFCSGVVGWMIERSEGRRSTLGRIGGAIWNAFFLLLP